MLTFVTWKWHVAGYRSTFTAEHVNVLASMIGRNYDAPHRVLCVTNESEGIDPAITIIPDREDFKDVPSPHGGKNPSCFRRLRMFEPNAAETFGDRFVSIDLDCVITSDLRPIVDRHDDFVGWSDVLRPRQYCGSLTMLRAGSRPKVWHDFDPATTPQKAVAAGCMGSDQGTVSYLLGPGESQWTQADGVYSFKWDKVGDSLPANARVVFFTGETDPWSDSAQRLAWVRGHWR